MEFRKAVRRGQRKFKPVRLALLTVGLCVLLLSPVSALAATLMQATGEVNVRKGPDTSEEALGQLQAGDTLYAVELLDNGWYRVVYTGETGYVPQDYLEPYGTADGEWDPPAETEAPAFQDGYGAKQGEAAEPGAAAGQKQPGQEAGQTAEQAVYSDNQSSSESRESGGGINILTILILVAVVVVIAVYAAVQIMKERRQGEYSSESEYPEDDGWTGSEERFGDGEGYVPDEEEPELLDLEDEWPDDYAGE